MIHQSKTLPAFWLGGLPGNNRGRSDWGRLERLGLLGYVHCSKETWGFRLQLSHQHLIRILRLRVRLQDHRIIGLSPGVSRSGWLLVLHPHSRVWLGASRARLPGRHFNATTHTSLAMDSLT